MEKDTTIKKRAAGGRTRDSRDTADLSFVLLPKNNQSRRPGSKKRSHQATPSRLKVVPHLLSKTTTHQGIMSTIIIRLGLCLITAMRSMFLVESYVVDGNAKGMNILARFADTQCKLLMTVGRTPNSDMRECPWIKLGLYFLLRSVFDMGK